MWRIIAGFVGGLALGLWFAPGPAPHSVDLPVPTVPAPIVEEFKKTEPAKVIRISRKTVEQLPSVGSSEPDIVEIPIPVETIKYIEVSKEYIFQLEKTNKELTDELIKSRAKVAHLEAGQKGMAWHIGCFSVGLAVGAILK